MIWLKTERLAILGHRSDHPAPKFGSKSVLRRTIERGKVVDPSEQSGNFWENEDLIFRCFSTTDLVEIGGVQTTRFGSTNLCYIGYSVVPKYAGQGYATEAVQAVVALALSHTDVAGIVAETFFDFTASIRVMEKVGFTKIETNVGPEIVRYGIVASEQDIDFSEPPVLALIPYRVEGNAQRKLILAWQWRNRIEFLPFIALIAFFTPPLALVRSLLGFAGYIGYGWYFGRRFYLWNHYECPLTLIQFREDGMFFATRAGDGYITAWTEIGRFRTTHRGGIELWIGDKWFEIPETAFTPALLADALDFLTLHGVVSASVGNLPT